MGKKRSLILVLHKQNLIIYGLLTVFILGVIIGRHSPSVIQTLLPGRAVLRGKVIVIDAGHGGRDPGAKGRSGLEEKGITLEISQDLQQRFSQLGAKVIMTRENDRDLANDGDRRYATFKERDLWRRVEIANKSKADIFLSIHVNSFPQSIWSGAQTFYQEGQEESAVLARAIQDQLVSRLGPNNRKARPANYRVLRSTSMPAATVEVGFLSNPREEGLLAQGDYRKRLAEAVFLGVIDYFNSPPPRRPPETLSPRSHVFPPILDSPLQSGQVRLYFADPNNSELLLRPEIRDIPGYQENWGRGKLAEAVLAELERGPGSHSALLPAAPVGKWLKGINLSGSTLMIDLSPVFPEMVDGGGASELMAIAAIVHTMTDLPGIDGVIFLLDGSENPSIAGHDLLDRVFRRKDVGFSTD